MVGLSLGEYASRFIGEPYEWSGFSWCEVYVQAWMGYYGMTEKKTFSSKTDSGSLQYACGHYFYDGNEFPTDEWDMEVTFTKKVMPPQVGNYMRNKVGGFFGEVLGVDEVGRYIWVRRDGNSRPETFEGYGLWEHVG